MLPPVFRRKLSTVTKRSRRDRLSWSLSSLEPRLLLAADAGVAAESSVEITQSADTDQVTAVANDTIASTSKTGNLVFIDSSLDETSQLAEFSRDSEVVLLHSDLDAITQITEALASRTHIAAIHIVSHGSVGKLHLAGETIDAASVESRSDEIAKWAFALAPNADILLYGCEVGLGSSGEALMQTIAKITGADVAASIDMTGIKELGGNWKLEKAIGDIEAGIAFEATILARYQHLLPISATENLLSLDSFSASDPIKTNGGALIAGNKLILTTDARFQAGSAFFTTPISVDNNTSFETSFSFEMGGAAGAGGADGFTFTLQNAAAGSNSLGGNAGWLGYGGIARSLTIEFDTWQNRWDQFNDEIAVTLNGAFQTQVAAAASPIDLNSGSVGFGWIDYDGSTNTLSVYVSNSNQKPQTPALTANVDLSSVVGDQLYAGFTGSNYDKPNSHSILSWNLNATLPQLPIEENTFYIETSQINVNEDDGVAVIRIGRTGDLSESGSVQYATANQSANAGSDYISNSGMAFFNAYQAVAEVQVSILDDSVAESPETFGFSLNSPIGGVLGNTSIATIRIADNDQPQTSSLPNFASFSAGNNIKINGGASITGNALQVTSAAAFQTGSAFFNTPIAFNSNTSFQTDFTFEMNGGAGASGADGMAFVLQSVPAGASALGGGAGWLGYGGIGNSVAIELDTWRNGWDSFNDEIALTVNGAFQTQLASAQSPINLNSGSVGQVWIDYDGNTNQLFVYVADSGQKPTTPTLTANIDLSSYIGNQIYAGFTASNYDKPNAHRVLSWTMNTDQPSDPSNNGPATFRLEGGQFTVGESASEAIVQVQRTGDASQGATVDYHTFDQTALSGSDYQTTSGQLYFVPGQRIAEIRIPIIDDNDEEGSETFSVTIDNPSNAELGAPRTAIVTIFDDEQSLPNFTDFNNGQFIDLNGGASLTGGKLQLTNTAAVQTGSAFFTEAIDVTSTSSFQTNFTFEINGGAGIGGADGLAFVLQNTPAGPGALGQGAYGLGYGGLVNSVAIELDTWLNAWDKYNDEIAITINGNIRVPVASSRSPIDLNGGGVYHAWVDYNGNSDVLAVYISATNEKPTLATVKATVNLQQILGNQMYVGFSASDYDKPNSHKINSWFMNNQIPAADPPVAPTGEIQSTVIQGGFIQPTAITWSSDGRNTYVSEKAGIVRVMRDGQLLASPLLDIRSLVNDYSDRGLLDVDVHPDLANNPYLYVLYTYDPPEVYSHQGVPYASPDSNGNRAGRMVRYTLDASTSYTTIVANSEFVMLGTASTWNNFNGFTNSVFNLAEKPAGQNPDGSFIRDFINSDSTTHSVAAMEFGIDGNLFVTIGDGASYNQMDPRAVRVQDVDSLSGKVLRIDPITGQGVSDNPFFNGDPNANRSKVFQSGLRNPFRIAVDDVTGRLFIGDVGWTTWEELNTGAPGANFGWPYYEGGPNGNIVTPGGYIGLPSGQAFVAAGGNANQPIFALNHQTDGIDAIIMGDVIHGGNLGQLFEGDILFNSLGQGIVRRATVDAQGNVTNVSVFTTGAQYVVDIKQAPDGNMYYVDLLDGQIGRWTLV